MDGYSDEEVLINVKEIESPIVLYTSGTTGRPKGAVRDPAKVNPLVFPLVMYDFNLSRDDILYTPCPLYHAAPSAFITFCLFIGATLIIGEKFDAVEALSQMDRHKATLGLMVPTHYNRLALTLREEFAKHDLTSLRGLISTGSNFAPSIKERIAGIFGDIIYDLYGGAEVGMSLLAKPADVAKRPESIGRPMSGVNVVLLDNEGNEVPAGKPGELHVKSRAIFDGYYGNKKATDDSTKRGFFTIGDVARRGDDGCYFICDRKSDMVVSGGVNIYPREIEDMLICHDSVQDAAVIGVPSDEWGEVVVAFVSLAEKKKVGAEEIRDYVGQRLAGYKKPKAVFFLPELPRNPQGKLLKKELKQRVEAGEFHLAV